MEEAGSSEDLRVERDAAKGAGLQKEEIFCYGPLNLCDLWISAAICLFLRTSFVLAWLHNLIQLQVVCTASNKRHHGIVYSVSSNAPFFPSTIISATTRLVTRSFSRLVVVWHPPPLTTPLPPTTLENEHKHISQHPRKHTRPLLRAVVV